MIVNNFLNNDIRANARAAQETKTYQSFYPYYNKPKIIPIIKKITGVLTILSLFFFVIANIAGYLIVNFDVLKKMYIGVFLSMVIWLHFFIMSLLAYQILKKPLTKHKFFYLSLWYPIISLFYNSFWIWNLFTTWNNIASEQIEHPFFLTWKILIIIHIICMVAVNALFIVGFFCNPKIDPQRIVKFQKELLNYHNAKIAGKEYQIKMNGLD